MSSKTEKNIQKEVMLRASHAGYTLFRNNTGQAWTSNEKHWQGRDLLLLDPHPVNFGLIKGSSDLIGYKPITVTPDMVGLTLAVFTGFEVKTATGRPTDDQIRFIDNVRQAGGIAGVVRCAGDVPS